MKLLIISNAAICHSDSNGNILARILKCFPKTDKRQFFIYGTPELEECESFYNVTDAMALNSFLKRNRANGLYKDKLVVDFKINKSKKTPLRKIIRDFIWKHSNIDDFFLKKWIEDFNPTCIFLYAADNCFLIDLARRFSNKIKIPIILFSTEDYPFKNYNYITKRFSLFYIFWQYKIKRAYSKVAKNVKCGVFNSENLADIYRHKYKYTCNYIYHYSDIEWISNYERNDHPTISYLGNLGVNRHKALIEIASALNSISSDIKLHIYGNASNEVKKDFQQCSNIVFEGFVSYDKVVEVIHNSTLLIHAEFEDAYSIRDLKYSFSTKISDSVCSGTPLFVYGSTQLTGINFLNTNKCAFVAKNKDELLDTLNCALFDEEKRNEVIKNAFLVRSKYFTNKGELKDIIDKALK